MNKILLGTCFLILSFSAMAATNKVEQAKIRVSSAIAKGFTVINYDSLVIIDVSSDTVNIETLECEENDSKNTSCTVDVKNKNAQNQQIVFLFQVSEDSGLITQVSQFIAEEE
ncbi:MAG: hypothetical protein Q7U04_07260 [Bacteriovorax sp.]|nr:hypothetical protein [Bacteriovorax sp.]